MASREEILDWLKTQKIFDLDIKYIDVTPTKPLVITPEDDDMQKIGVDRAEELAHKIFGKDVMQNLGNFIMACGYFMQQGKLTLKQFQKLLIEYEDGITGRQNDLEDQFKDVLANATKDSEVINARDSSIYGKYPTLDDRLEHIEQLLAQQAPGGFVININHGLAREPTVKVAYYEYAIGTEPDGLGTAPTGLGGTEPIEVPVSTSYPDKNNIKITLPIAYTLSGRPYYQPADRRWYLIDGYRTLRFDLGVTAKDKPNTGQQDETLVTPRGLKASQVSAGSAKLDWE